MVDIFERSHVSKFNHTFFVNDVLLSQVYDSEEHLQGIERREVFLLRSTLFFLHEVDQYRAYFLQKCQGHVRFRAKSLMCRYP